MDITEKEYKNNLLFYTILKDLLKCQLTEKRLITLEETVEQNQSLNCTKMKQLLSTGIVNENTKKYDDFMILLNLANDNNYEMWKDLIIVSIELLLTKDLILEESKSYARKKYKEKIDKISDKLSLEYDMSNLEYPYSQRVISSLLVFVLTNINRETEFILETSQNSIKVLNDKLKYISEKYNINVNNMFMIIIDESINQSIKSDAGQEYENRVHSLLLNISDNVEGHSHDDIISSVEYDFTFIIDDKKYGVSAKRTLRERYKQNFEDVDFLTVDAMFLITLGIDLNEDKLNNILQKKGQFVIVADEVYESKEYLKNNARVLSSKNITKDNIINILKQEL
jgi:hypothetical protein